MACSYSVWCTCQHILKVALTLANLENADAIGEAEATACVYQGHGSVKSHQGSEFTLFDTNGIMPKASE